MYAREKLCDYLLSDEYITLLERALYSRLATTSGNTEKHTHAIHLLEKYKESKEEG